MKKVLFINIALLFILIYVCISYNHRQAIVNTERPIEDFSVLEINYSSGYRGGSTLLVEFNAKNVSPSAVRQSDACPQGTFCDLKNKNCHELTRKCGYNASFLVQVACKSKLLCRFACKNQKHHLFTLCRLACKNKELHPSL